jgi:cytochrome c553
MVGAVVLLSVAVAFAACSKKEEGKAATGGGAAAAGTADMVAARAEFKNRCATCHGEEGKGNGPAAGALNPKPRNYTDTTWQKSVTDDQIKKTIVMGGAAVGKSPIMPASPDLDSKPEVLNGIVAVVRAFDGK